MSIENDRKTIHTAINVGADGYMLKDSAGTEIVNAIRIVHKCEKYIDKSLVSILFSDIKIKDKKVPSVLDNLSKREIEVLIKISKGLSNKEIGEQLFLSEKTIKNYATNLFRKIEVADRVQATILAIENNIEEYCRKNKLNLLGKIKHDKSIAKVYSNGELIHDKFQDFSDGLIRIYKNICNLVTDKAGII